MTVRGISSFRRTGASNNLAMPRRLPHQTHLACKNTYAKIITPSALLSFPLSICSFISLARRCSCACLIPRAEAFRALLHGMSIVDIASIDKFARSSA